MGVDSLPKICIFLITKTLCIGQWFEEYDLGENIFVCAIRN